MFGQQVDRYEEREGKGIVYTKTKEEFQGDIIIAADGVGSKAHEAVTGKSSKALSSGFAIYRSIFPTAIAMRSKLFEENLAVKNDERPRFRIFIGGWVEIFDARRMNKIN